MREPEHEMLDMREPSYSQRSSTTFREPAAPATPATTLIHRRPWSLIVFTIYAAIAVLSWVLLCIMNKRPIRIEKDYFQPDTYNDMEKAIQINEKYIKAAQVLHSIATLLTIPVTGAICSMAFVAYMQTGNLRKKLSLRQTMAFADHGWLSLRVWAHIKSTGSLPFYVAFGLTLIGSASQIVQTALINSEHIGTGGGGTWKIARIMDVPDFWGENADHYPDNGILISKLRRLADISHPKSTDWNVWIEEPAKYNPSSERLVESSKKYWEDYVRTNTTPYFVDLPSDFSTGDYSNPTYEPRINSSVVYTNITEEEFSNDCRNETDTGGFYARYEWTGGYNNWYDLGFTACMPGDLRNSPWKPIRDRQDITEVLYLNISTRDRPEPVYYKTTAKTSLGYFELPSTRNGNQPGPLLAEDPIPEESESPWKRNSALLKRENITNVGNYSLADVTNKGPLMSLALALFGPDSFIDTRMSNPDAYVMSPREYEDDWPADTLMCRDLFPFGTFNEYSFSCMRTSTSRFRDAGEVASRVSDWLSAFTTTGWSGYSPSITIEVGLFQANKLWLGDTPERPTMGRQIYYAVGTKTIKPKISDAGVVVGSIFLALHIIGLLALAIYAYHMKPWAPRLGSEVILRMGGVYADVLEASGSKWQWKKVTESLPGYIGDETPEEPLGRMRVGAEAGLARIRDRKFEILR